MQWTGLNELREQFLAYFESKGHLRAQSASLVPQNDPSLLLINSGMAPLKKYFTGEAEPPRRRMTTCQKCIRTPDIENVGITARHGTYFEMLGNFSFGDYFKREAITWGWEFFTKTLGMDPALLYITVYLEDDEAWDIWTKEIGIPVDHMARMGKADNFWEHGKGPCGPCSEIHYDRGARYGCGKPGCTVGCDCDRFMEIWNLVFTQFDSDGEGHYAELDMKNIDTGMGLERLACVTQGVDNMFEVDTMQNIMKHITRVAGVQYHADAKNDISLRVITDHIRSTTMMVGDGVLPSNEGRGYVLRRLLRRAARHGRLLGVDRPFLSEVAVTVIEENAGAYPSLVEKQDFILRVIANEEENFSRTIDAGLGLLSKMLAPGTVLSGADAFKLSDTYGFPIDLTKEILAENDMTVDEAAFKKLALEQRERSRAARKEAGGWDSEGGLDTKDLPATEFLGYDLDECEATVLAAFDDMVVLDRTPFYAESGGQCGDEGRIGDYAVTGTTKTPEGVVLHHCESDLRAGDTVTAKVRGRDYIRANHTAAHLLHAALRKVLGNHVEQAGQSVTPQSVRFDFTHFAAMTQEELGRVERSVNEAIRAAIPARTEVLPIEEAKARGAMALFGEKYGDTVRMVSVPGYSMELCGGTHAENTGNLGMFLIESESSVASGVRRIEAVTRDGVAKHYRAKQREALERNEALLKQIKEKDNQIVKYRQALSQMQFKEQLVNAKEIGGVTFVSTEFDDAEQMRASSDTVKKSAENLAALFYCKTEKGMQLMAACSPGAVKAGAHAGNLVRAAAQAAGGSGGGKPDSAMAGGKDPSKLDDALAAGEAALRAMLKA